MMRKWVQSFPQGVPLMFVNIILMYAGFYAIIPFLFLYLSEDLLWSSTLVGILLTTRQISQQGLTLFTGMMSDRLGYKVMLTVGMIVRGAGFAMFGFFTHPAGLFLAAVTAGIGGAMFEPARDASLTALTPEPERGRMFAVKKLVGNLGIAASALLSAMLFQFDFQVLSYTCGAIYLFAALLTYWRLPSIHVQITPVPFQRMWKTVSRDRTFVQFTLITCGFYFMYMQTFLTIPMQAVAITGLDQIVSLVNLLLATIIIVAQVPVSRLIARFDLLTGIKIGLGLMACGLVLLGTTDALTVFLIGFAMFAIGVMIVEPSNNELIAKLAKREVTATYFGFAMVALAVGGGLGQGLGGWLIETGKGVGFPSLIWWVAGGIGLLALWGMDRMARKLRRQQKSLSTEEKGVVCS